MFRYIAGPLFPFTPASTRLEQLVNLVHASAKFDFDLDFPYDFVAPLFGAKEEQNWAAGWAPHFLHPAPAADIEGAVFLTDEATAEARIWINTIFDLAGGRVQYVYLLNKEMITRIDIRLAGKGPDKTGVSVTYDRTSLEPSANDKVLAMSEGDRANGPVWRKEIETYAGAAARK